MKKESGEKVKEKKSGGKDAENVNTTFSCHLERKNRFQIIYFTFPCEKGLGLELLLFPGKINFFLVKSLQLTKDFEVSLNSQSWRVVFGNYIIVK